MNGGYSSGELIVIKINTESEYNSRLCVKNQVEFMVDNQIRIFLMDKVEVQVRILLRDK
jgi:hypothetical protein